MYFDKLRLNLIRLEIDETREKFELEERSYLLKDDSKDENRLLASLKYENIMSLMASVYQGFEEGNPK
jgi:hypothetical protein